MHNQLFITIEYDQLMKDIENIVKKSIPVSEPKPIEINQEYITKNDVAALLSVSKSSVNNYSRKGILKPYTFAGNVRYKREEVLKLFKKHI